MFGINVNAILPNIFNAPSEDPGDYLPPELPLDVILEAEDRGYFYADTPALDSATDLIGMAVEYVHCQSQGGLPAMLASGTITEVEESGGTLFFRVSPFAPHLCPRWRSEHEFRAFIVPVQDTLAVAIAS